MLARYSPFLNISTVCPCTLVISVTVNVYQPKVEMDIFTKLVLSDMDPESWLLCYREAEVNVQHRHKGVCLCL